MILYQNKAGVRVEHGKVFTGAAVIKIPFADRINGAAHKILTFCAERIRHGCLGKRTPALLRAHGMKYNGAG